MRGPAGCPRRSRPTRASGPPASSPSSAPPAPGRCRCFGFADAERPSMIVSAPSTPPLLREAGKALAAPPGRQRDRRARRRPARRRTSAPPRRSRRWRWGWPASARSRRGLGSISITPPRRASTAPPSSSTARIAVGTAARTVTSDVDRVGGAAPAGAGPQPARERLGGEVAVEGEQVQQRLPHRGHARRWPGGGLRVDLAGRAWRAAARRPAARA